MTAILLRDLRLALRHGADAVLAAGGEVYGVIPDFLDRIEVGHRTLTDLKVKKDPGDKSAPPAGPAPLVLKLK